LGWLVEGAGGVLVPINPKTIHAGHDGEVQTSVILPLAAGLAPSPHLLTLAALHAAELPVHGLVLIGDQNRENRETLKSSATSA